MDARKIPKKIRMQLEELKNIPKRFEELEKLSLGQKVIVGNEGVMKFAGVRLGYDDEIGASWWGNPIFLSEIIEDKEVKYKEIEMLTKCSPCAIYREIIGKDNKNYNYVKKIWGNLN